MTDEQINERYKRVYKTFQLMPVENNRRFERFNLDKNIEMITAIQINSDQKSKLAYRGKLGLRIGSDIIFDDNTPLHLFVSSASVPVKDRFFPLGEVKPATQVMEVSYTDEDNTIAAWGEGYKVEISIEYLVNK